MTLTIVAFAFAMTSTFASAFLASVSFWHYSRQSKDSFERTKRYPNEERNAKLVAEIEHGQKQLEEMRKQGQKQLGDIQDELASAREHIQQAQRAREYIEQTRQEIQELEELKQEVIRVENEYQTRAGELAGANQELKQAISDADKKNEELVQLRKEYDVADRKLTQFTDKVEQLKQAKKLLDSEVKELNEKKRQLDASIPKLESREIELQRICSELVDKQSKLTKENEELARSISEFKKQKAELEVAIAELSGKKAAIKTEVDLTANVLSASGGKATNESNLWMPALDSVASAVDGSLDELKCLREFENELTEDGFKFDSRTIYAFHTALKSTNSSPLVTLAGVSGTGKSELPKRYAEALGVNFLNMAVQPRWDSPQDLFGFYDYLERRYRPTELLRGLLQMDPIGPEDGRGWDKSDGFKKHRRHDQMLLVLFDEMNLARVEYYFSDFLSKLETRRGIEPNKEVDERKKAEIVLDVGGNQKDAQPLRLFVHSNVLFVGTMNEDESTQALSDKVIDRSNVLRFGSPAKFEPQKPNIRENTKSEKPRLLHNHWSEWQNNWTDLQPSDEKRLVDWIEKIRLPLAAAGRPFAYRVSYSILEYAANYPKVRDRIENAISDQIEQRVLPKLIGLDTQGRKFEAAIQAIRTVLDEVGDEKLIQAIDACIRDEDYFQWNGLDRTA